MSYVNVSPHRLFKHNEPIIRNLVIELTERCNNNCVHCYINLPEDDAIAQNKELSGDEWKRIIKEAVDLGLMTVCFSGGEPFLREDFKELYFFTRKLGVRVIIYTNACLITPELAEFLAVYPPLEKIEVTVYGMHRESYESVSRVPGSFEKFSRGVNLLLERKIPFIVKNALLPQNKAEIEEFEAWAADIPWMDQPPPYAMFFNLRGRRDNAEKNELIEKLRLSPEEGLKFLTRDEERYLKGQKEFCAKFMYPQGKKLFSCGAGHNGGCIDAYGRLQLCMLLRHPDTVYDLKKETLKDTIINFFPKIREKEAKNTEYLKRCARCFLRGLCEQCPAKSWLEHGDLDVPVEYLCEVAHAKARYLDLIKEGERGWDVEDWQARVSKFVKSGTC